MYVTPLPFMDGPLVRSLNPLDRKSIRKSGSVSSALLRFANRFVSIWLYGSREVSIMCQWLVLDDAFNNKNRGRKPVKQKGPSADPFPT